MWAWTPTQKSLGGAASEGNTSSSVSVKTRTSSRAILSNFFCVLILVKQMWCFCRHCSHLEDPTMSLRSKKTSAFSVFKGRKVWSCSRVFEKKKRRESWCQRPERPPRLRPPPRCLRPEQPPSRHAEFLMRSHPRWQKGGYPGLRPRQPP